MPFTKKFVGTNDKEQKWRKIAKSNRSRGDSDIGVIRQTSKLLITMFKKRQEISPEI